MPEKPFPIFTACRLSIKYEENQLNAVPYISYHVYKRLMRMSRSVVSDSADSSGRVSAVTLAFSMLRLMSLFTFKRTVSVNLKLFVCRLRHIG